MSESAPFVSYAQNREDVVLNRAFQNVAVGRYIEVGANHPRVDSISRGFYERGWSGLEFEPNPEFARMFREERPRDTVIQAAVTSRGGESVTFHVVAGTGLSTLVDEISSDHAAHGFQIVDIEVTTVRLDDAIDEHGLADQDVHFLMVDTEGAEPEVLASMDFARHRPWVLVIEATVPGTSEPSHDAWEPLVLAAGYEFCQFDGLSRFYVAREHADLKAILSIPASSADRYTTDYEARTNAELTRALGRAEEAEHELDRVLTSHSWKVTRPLRALRRRLGG